MAARQPQRDQLQWQKVKSNGTGQLIRDLAALGHHRLGVVESFPTLGYEFVVTSGKGIPADLVADRLAALQANEVELAEMIPGASGSAAVSALGDAPEDRRNATADAAAAESPPAPRVGAIAVGRPRGG